MDGHCRNTEAGKVAFHFPRSAKLREVAGGKITIAHSAGTPAENSHHRHHHGNRSHPATAPVRVH